MIIKIDKTKLMLISSKQKRKCMKYNNLAHVYDNFDLQLKKTVESVRCPYR